MTDTPTDEELAAAYHNGDLGPDEPATDDTDDDTDDGRDIPDGDAIDWAQVWADAGFEDGVGTFSMTQLKLVVCISDATGDAVERDAQTLVDEAVEAGLLAEVRRSTYELTGGRSDV